MAAAKKEEEKVDVKNPIITIELIDGHPDITFVNWEVFNARMMHRVNRAINRQRMRLRRITIKEAKDA